MSATAAQVSTASGQVIGIPDGDRLVFGRGPDVDLEVPGDQGLSRRAGVIAALHGGAWVANLSRTHAIYVVGEDYRIRLPRMEDHGDPRGGWLVRAGAMQVGSRRMLDDDRPLQVEVAPPPDAGRLLDAAARTLRPDPEATVLPLHLDPHTKLFLVALMWCRPWLLDLGRATPLPRTPEIARAALEVTDAAYELERFDTDPGFRERLSARVGEHVKVLRHKITERGLVRAGVRLSDEVVVEVLLEHGVITPSDLGRLDDPGWCSRQEDLWWTRRP